MKVHRLREVVRHVVGARAWQHLLLEVDRS